MIRVSALYPNRPGARFDHDYYATKHRALVERAWGPFGLRRIEIDRGMAGAGGAEPPFVAAAHLEFDSIEGFQRAAETAGAEVFGDIANYTDLEPTIQISQIAPQVELPPISR